MKKICFITTVPITLKAFVLELAKYLHTNGEYDISFICNYDKNFEESLPKYIHYYPVPMERGISLSGLNAMFEIYKIFKREKYDIIQYSTPNASCYAALAGSLARIPVRLYCQWGIAYVGFSGLKRKIFKLIEKTVCNLSTWIEPDSFGNLNFSHTEKLYSSRKGSVIWNGSASGVNTKKFNISKKPIWKSSIRKQYNIPENATVFIFVGRITKDKGVNELLSAAKELCSEYNDIYLLMVGANENPDSVNAKLYEWSQNSENVIYCGFTNEVEKYLAASDIYILPSYREGFGSAVIEAEAMGIPVIVSNIPGPTDAMKNNNTGLVVKKGSVSDLKNAMKTLYCNYNLRENYGKNAYKFATENFEQNKLFEKIMKDRAELLSEKTK